MRAGRQWVRAHQGWEKTIGCWFQEVVLHFLYPIAIVTMLSAISRGYKTGCLITMPSTGMNMKGEGVDSSQYVWQMNEWRMQEDGWSTCKSVANLAAYNPIHPIYHQFEKDGRWVAFPVSAMKAIPVYDHMVQRFNPTYPWWTETKCRVDITPQSQSWTHSRFPCGLFQDLEAASNDTCTS